MGSLELVDASEEEQEEEQIIKKRPHFSFKLLGIPVGTELSYIRDDSVTCVVADTANHVSYNGELTTLSALAAQLLGHGGPYSIQGTLYFVYDGEVLSDRRNRLESEAGGEE